MNKSKRTVTVESSSCQEEEKASRRPSVFDRLGPGAMPSSKERHAERQEQCRNWLRNGECIYGSHCKYQHKRSKSSKSSHERHASPEYKKAKSKMEDCSRSPSPVLFKTRREKTSSLSHKSKIDYETKLRSTIVKPKSPIDSERSEKVSSRDTEKGYRKSKKEVLKKPLEQQWEEDEQDDSDDWDAARLDYKEELTLVMKRQQLQRELELEMQKEEMEKRRGNEDVENVLISKKVRSSSSSSSSSSQSSSASSSSITSSSSSSSSDSGSDSDSSGSSSGFSQNAEKYSKGHHKKSQSRTAQRSSKYKSSHLAAGRRSPQPKSESKKISKGPRTPSPVKSSRRRNELEHGDYGRKDKKQKGKQKVGSAEKRKRYSLSPPTSPGSSVMVGKQRHSWKNEPKKPSKMHNETVSPPRSYSESGPRKDKYDKSHIIASSASHKRTEHSSHQSPNSRDSSRAGADSQRRGRSPYAPSNRMEIRYRSSSPRETYPGEKSKYSSEKNKVPASPSIEERSKGYKERRLSREPKERVLPTAREENRPRDQYSPSRSRNSDPKGGRYPNYYEDDRRRQQSSQSPSRRSRRNFNPDHEPSLLPRDRLPPPHPDSEIIAHDRHKEKIHGGAYGGESSRGRQMYETEGYESRNERGFRESEFRAREDLHRRDYLSDPLRDRELPFRNIDGHREPYPDLPRERDYGRLDYVERDYFQDPNMYGGRRDNVGRRAYASRVPEDRRRDPLYDIPAKERHHDHYIDMPIDDREFPPLLPEEELDRNSRRRGRPGHYLPESDIRGKHDWHMHPGEFSDLPSDRYGYHHLDYPMDPHGWDERPREVERDRDPYYGGRRHPRMEPDDRGNKRRHEDGGYSGSAWEMSDYQSKRDYPPNERDYLPPREQAREREPRPDSEKDRRKDPAHEGDKKIEGTWPERRGRKRERSNTPDRLSEHADKRSRDSCYERKNESAENSREDRRGKKPVPGLHSSETHSKSDRKPTDSDTKADDNRYDDRRSTSKRSDQRENSHERLRNSPDRRSEKSTQGAASTSSKRSRSLDGSIKDDGSEKSNKDFSSERRRNQHDSRDRDRNRSPEDCDRFHRNDRRSKAEITEKRETKDADTMLRSNENSGETESKSSERRKPKRPYKPDVEDPIVDFGSSKKPRRNKESTSIAGTGSDNETNLGTKGDGKAKLSKEEKILASGDEDDNLKSVNDVKKLSESLLKEEMGGATKPVSSEAGSFKCVSPIPEKTVVVDEVFPRELAEERVIDSYKGSDAEDNKEIEEELSEWSDSDDELLTRDELIEQEPEQDSKEAESKTNSVPKPVEVPVQKAKRIEEIKADHSKRSSPRSSSSERQYRERSHRSLSSERSRESREGSRERHRSRDRNRNDKSRYSKESSSRSGSRNTSLERSKHDSATRGYVGEHTSKSLREKEDSSVQNGSKSRGQEPAPNVDNFDYDPISDDELEAMIEEPANSEISEANYVPAKKPGIVDALNVDWASLMGSNDRTVEKTAKTKATQQFKPGKIFSRIGFSVALVTPELAEQIKNICQEELLKENDENKNEDVKFELKHDVAALHAAAISQKEERDQVLTNIGPYRRALCARQDLQIRQKLCRFHHRLPDHLSSAINTTQQNIDPELYQMSVNLFKSTPQNSSTVF